MRTKLLKKLRKKANREIDFVFRIVEVERGKYVIAKTIYSTRCPECNPRTEFLFMDNPIPKTEANKFIIKEKRKLILSLNKRLRMKRTLPNPQI